MSVEPDYQAFLEAKRVEAPISGLVVPEADINPALRPHARIAARWALAGGTRAIFARFGLHKTTMQLEILRQIKRRVGGALPHLPPARRGR